MTRGSEPVCDVPQPEHTGPTRLYPCGWRCTTHAPVPRTPLDEQNGQAP